MSSTTHLVSLLCFQAVKINRMDLIIQNSKKSKVIFIKVFCPIIFIIFPIFEEIDFINQYFKTIYLLTYSWCSKPQPEASNITKWISSRLRALKLCICSKPHIEASEVTVMYMFEASCWGLKLYRYDLFEASCWGFEHQALMRKNKVFKIAKNEFLEKWGIYE